MNETLSHPLDLLPFFVNGSLQADELAEVATHLADCQDCREEVLFLQTLHQGVRQAEAATAPVEMGWQRLQREIGSGRKQRRQAWLKPALAASLLVVVVQSGWLLQQSLNQDGYIPAGNVAAGSVLQIRFQPQATEAQIRTLLDQAGAQLIDGPGALGVYRIRLDVGADDAEALQKRLALLRASDEVVAYVAPD